MITPKDMAISHLNSSNVSITSDQRKEVLRIIIHSKEGDNPFLAAQIACYPSVMNSADYFFIVNKALHTKDVGQAAPTKTFLSRHGEHTNNPNYVTNIDTVNLLLSSKNEDQAYYRGQMANHLTNDRLLPQDIHSFMCLIRKNDPLNHYSSLMQIYLSLDEVTRNRLIEEIKCIEENYRVDYILQYTSDPKRYDSDDKLRELAEFIRDIKGTKTEEEAEMVYKNKLKSMYEIPNDVDTLEYPWGELKIVRYEIDRKVISKTTTFNGEQLLPGSVILGRSKKLITPELKKHHS